MTYQPSVMSNGHSTARESRRTFSTGQTSTVRSFEQATFSDGHSYVPGESEGDESEPWASRVYIGVDYGTTYTGVGWAVTAGEKPDLKDIHHIFSWPGIRSEAKTPSTLTYSPVNGGTDQWGGGIGSGALVIRWTKLEIEPPTMHKALEILRDTISETSHMEMDPQKRVFGSIPRHLIHSSEDIMTRYLTGVLDFARKGIIRQKEAITLQNNKIDLIITHPAVWDERAKNITFRSVVAAFKNAFNDLDCQIGNLRLASESEACAQYLMKEARDRRTMGFRAGECFIVVDAGGGTVDLAAYQVMEVNPNFRVRRVTNTIGARCGATEIDRCFLKEYLRAKLDPQDFEKLKSGEGSAHSQGSHVVFSKKEEEILESFTIIKHEFKGVSTFDNPRAAVQRMPLPEGIGEVNRPDIVEDGHLIIHEQDLKTMFDLTINSVTDLVEQQLNLLWSEGLQNGKIFLSGGFSRNEYLFSRIRELAQGYTFKVVRSDDKDSSWTAVAKGAVLMGMGLDCQVPPPVIASPFCIGAVLSTHFKPHTHRDDQRYVDSFEKSPRARNHTHWMVRKGDLVTMEGRHASIKLRRKFNAGGKKSGVVHVVISQNAGLLHQKDPQASQPYLAPEEVIRLDYDLDNLPKHVANNVVKAGKSSGNKFYQVEMTLDVWVYQTTYTIELTCGKTVGMLGDIGAPGFLLDSRRGFFPGSERGPGVGSSVTWGGSSAA